MPTRPPGDARERREPPEPELVVPAAPKGLDASLLFGDIEQEPEFVRAPRESVAQAQPPAAATATEAESEQPQGDWVKKFVKILNTPL